MSDGQELARLLRVREEQLLDPQIRSPPTQVASMLADDSREFGRSGHIIDKTEAIADLSGEPRSPVMQRSLHDFRAQLLAEGVPLVTYGSILRLPDGSELRSLRSSVWIWRDRRWQMSFHQGTPASHPS